MTGYQFYRRDGFVFRTPLPRDITTVNQMEVWDDVQGWTPLDGIDERADVYWYGTPLDDDPTQHNTHLAEAFSLPTIQDVSVPNLLKGISVQFQPTKRKKVGRKPKRFEASLMSLATITPTLDLHLDALRTRWVSVLHDTESSFAVLLDAMHQVAKYGAAEVRSEFLRQDVVTLPGPRPILAHAVSDLLADFTEEVKQAFADVQKRLARKRVRETTRRKWAADLMERSVAPLITKYANRAINEGFARGRRAELSHILTNGSQTISLAKRKKKKKDDDDDYPLDLSEITVVQTAILDNATCEHCEEVNGESFEYGSDRMAELDPPYTLCLGRDRCRCQQLAIIGKDAIDVDEITDEELEDLLRA